MEVIRCPECGRVRYEGYPCPSCARLAVAGKKPQPAPASPRPSETMITCASCGIVNRVGAGNTKPTCGKCGVSLLSAPTNQPRPSETTVKCPSCGTLNRILPGNTLPTCGKCGVGLLAAPTGQPAMLQAPQAQLQAMRMLAILPMLLMWLVSEAISFVVLFFILGLAGVLIWLVVLGASTALLWRQVTRPTRKTAL